MDGLYFLATIIGVSWLCLWVMRERPGPSGWSPFDMREPPVTPVKASSPIERIS